MNPADVKKAIQKYHANPSEEELKNVRKVFRQAVLYIPINGDFDGTHAAIPSIHSEDGKAFIPLYTSQDVVPSNKKAEGVTAEDWAHILKQCPDITGFAVDPSDTNFAFTRPFIDSVLALPEEEIIASETPRDTLQGASRTKMDIPSPAPTTSAAASSPEATDIKAVAHVTPYDSNEKSNQPEAPTPATPEQVDTNSPTDVPQQEEPFHTPSANAHISDSIENHKQENQTVSHQQKNEIEPQKSRIPSVQEVLGTPFMVHPLRNEEPSPKHHTNISHYVHGLHTRVAPFTADNAEQSKEQLSLDEEFTNVINGDNNISSENVVSADTSIPASPGSPSSASSASSPSADSPESPYSADSSDTSDTADTADTPEVAETPKIPEDTTNRTEDESRESSAKAPSFEIDGPSFLTGTPQLTTQQLQDIRNHIAQSSQYEATSEPIGDDEPQGEGTSNIHPQEIDDNDTQIVESSKASASQDEELIHDETTSEDATSSEDIFNVPLEDVYAEPTEEDASNIKNVEPETSPITPILTSENTSTSHFAFNDILSTGIYFQEPIDAEVSSIVKDIAQTSADITGTPAWLLEVYTPQGAGYGVVLKTTREILETKRPEIENAITETDTHLYLIPLLGELERFLILPAETFMPSLTVPQSFTSSPTPLKEALSTDSLNTETHDFDNLGHTDDVTSSIVSAAHAAGFHTSQAQEIISFEESPLHNETPSSQTIFHNDAISSNNDAPSQDEEYDNTNVEPEGDYSSPITPIKPTAPISAPSPLDPQGHSAYNTHLTTAIPNYSELVHEDVQFTNHQLHNVPIDEEPVTPQMEYVETPHPHTSVDTGVIQPNYVPPQATQQQSQQTTQNEETDTFLTADPQFPEITAEYHEPEIEEYAQEVPEKAAPSQSPQVSQQPRFEVSPNSGTLASPVQAYNSQDFAQPHVENSGKANPQPYKQQKIEELAQNFDKTIHTQSHKNETGFFKKLFGKEN
ncbi:MAG: SseB family protein [Actinomycetaceae bacterium]|nr:SseB family protein [Actinomycetaceae bacterium]